MRDFLSITKALADENRLRLLLALRGGELCLCQLIELLGLAPSTVSKHMSVLWGARLADRIKRGRWSYYCLAGEDAPAPVREALRWVTTNLDAVPRAVEDTARLEAIMKMDPEKLCLRQRLG